MKRKNTIKKEITDMTTSLKPTGEKIRRLAGVSKDRKRRSKKYVKLGIVKLYVPGAGM